MPIPVSKQPTKLTREASERLAAILNIPPLELLSDKEPVIHFSDPSPPPPVTGKGRTLEGDHRK